ncbi:MAG: translocation/assembly module TamB domain-containing protein, partial [Gammaproteobacteria bacterium]|nr:translocation/assembly module TamB domain-containing protein [Gammaproteobacteria bacterium]
LSVNWRPLALLTANIDITRLHLQALKIVIPPSEKANQPQPLNLPDINFPWRILLKKVLIDDVSIIQNEQRIDLQQIKFSATTLLSQINIDELNIVANDFSLNITGELQPIQDYSHQLTLRWQLALASKALLKGKGRLVGNIHKSRLNQQISGPLKLTLNAEINDFFEHLSWQVNIDVTEFNTAKLNPGWPALSGKLMLNGSGDLGSANIAANGQGQSPELGLFDADVSLQWLNDNSIHIENLMLHSPVNDSRIQAYGQWLPDNMGGNLALTLDWQNLSWPLTGDARFNSPLGSGRMTGNTQQYQLALTADLLIPQAPASTVYVSAKGNLDGLDVSSLRITTLEGEVTAKGKLTWSPQLAWQAQLSGRDINPAKFWPEWPGQLKTTLSSNGRIENGQLIASTDISDLTGTLRGYPVSLRTGFDWRNNGLEISHFDFRSGTSEINAQGRIGDSLNLNIAIDANDLGDFYPKAKGQLNAKALLTGPKMSPTITTSFMAKALHLPDYDIASLDGTVVVDLLNWQQVDIMLTAQALKFKEHTLQSLVINADSQQLEIKLISEAINAQIKLIGEPMNEGWLGKVEQVEIKSQRFANWHLKQPATFFVSQKSLLSDNLCLLSNQQASLCVSLNHNNKQWQSRLVSRKIPLQLLDPLLPPDLTLEGVANTTAELTFQMPNQLMGQAQIDLPAGTVSYPLLIGERDHWQYQHAKASIILNKQGLQADAQIAINNGDQFKAQLTLPGAKLLALEPQNQALQAHVSLAVHDLGLFETIMTDIYDLRGEANLNINASGSLAQPRFTGQAHLLNASLRIPRLGLYIDQIKFNSQSKGLETLRFNLEAHSGNGNLVVKGQTRLDRGAGWPTQISIKGSDFEISRIPEARILLTPDLQVKLINRHIDIEGNVHIPYAKLQPKDITTAVRVSADTVIVDGEQKTPEKWNITSKIRLTLGDRVNFYGFGFEGRLGGNLLLQDEPGQLTAATGEITIPEGRYRAYGQRLNVEYGRLLYTGGPLSNPGLDLRAVRKVNNITAGLKVGGSLNQPRIDLFSIPAMGQTDTLAYLLLGRPIENASDEDGAMMAKAVLALGLSGGDRLARTLGNRFGLDEMRVESSDRGDQASLVMGRYMSPKLYISYGVGLIETINTFNVRYQISDRLQLKGESGEHQGADFLYTIER